MASVGCMSLHVQDASSNPNRQSPNQSGNEEPHARHKRNVAMYDSVGCSLNPVRHDAQSCCDVPWQVQAHAHCVQLSNWKITGLTQQPAGRTMSSRPLPACEWCRREPSPPGNYEDRGVSLLASRDIDGMAKISIATWLHAVLTGLLR